MIEIDTILDFHEAFRQIYQSEDLSKFHFLWS